MSESKTYTANLSPKVEWKEEQVKTRDEVSLQPDQTSEPKPEKRYTVRAVLSIDVEVEIVPDGDEEHLRLQQIASSQTVWNNLPMVGVLAIEEQWEKGLTGPLRQLGAVVAFQHETEPTRKSALQAMVTNLPQAAILKLMEGQSDGGS